MANVRFTGLESLQMQLSELGAKSEAICKRGVYAGANVLADAVRSEVNNLRTGGSSQWETDRREMQKKGLQDSLGISTMRNENGFINVLIGFNGYNEKGQANTMIARVFNSGNSFTSKQPFIKRAVNKSKAQAINAMQMAMDEEIKEITKGDR